MTLLKIFLQWFSLLAIPMFAAGAVADPGVAEGGSDGEVISDAGDGSADVSEPDSSVEPAAGEGDGDVPAVPTEGEPTDQPGQDTRVLTGPIRKILAEAKATNPEGYKQLKAEIFTGREAKQKLESLKTRAGVEKVEDVFDRLDEIGGFEAVEEIQGEVQDYRQLDTAWINGDPTFIETAVNAFPDGFKKLMPGMLDKYSQIDRDGYNREMARVVNATIRNAELPTNLYLLKRIFSSVQDQNLKQEGLQLLGGLEQWVKGINDLASQRPQPTAEPQKNAELEQREQSIQQRESEQFFNSVGGQAANYQRTEIAKELKQLTGNKPVSNDALRIIHREVMDSLMERLAKDPGFTSKYDRYCDARDMQGALKFLNTRAVQLIPELTKKAYRGIYGQAKLGGKPNPTTKPGEKPVAQVPKGWVKVSGPPKAEEVDSYKSKGLIFHSQAVLRDGKKVYWGDRAPSA